MKIKNSSSNDYDNDTRKENRDGGLQDTSCQRTPSEPHIPSHQPSQEEHHLNMRINTVSRIRGLTRRTPSWRTSTGTRTSCRNRPSGRCYGGGGGRGIRRPLSRRKGWDCRRLGRRLSPGGSIVDGSRAVTSWPQGKVVDWRPLSSWPCPVGGSLVTGRTASVAARGLDSAGDGMGIGRRRPVRMRHARVAVAPGQMAGPGSARRMAWRRGRA